MITLVLVSVETVFLYAFLPETKGFKAPVDEKSNAEKTSSTAKLNKARTVPERINLLGNLRLLHFLFLGIFSGTVLLHIVIMLLLTLRPITGVEFTLTFLTFDCKVSCQTHTLSPAHFCYSVRLV